MSQQKQRPCELPDAPKCSPPQCPNPGFAPCCSTCSGGYCLHSQRSGAQSPGRPRRTRRKPRCLRGGTIYHCKEEEC
ncbi:late cornified envelope protein 6A [Loxodonta africana]|uniref:late cornified envelope protein 6A n=1 Tax=Loxodonta africana TaxID=9785 RepID=UPI00054043D3|nr:late cornified envelope protein 6A [Loxodonta africana]